MKEYLAFFGVGYDYGVNASDLFIGDFDSIDDALAAKGRDRLGEQRSVLSIETGEWVVFTRVRKPICWRRES